MPHPHVSCVHNADDLIFEAILVLNLRQCQETFELKFEAIMILNLRPWPMVWSDDKKNMFLRQLWWAPFAICQLICLVSKWWANTGVSSRTLRIKCFVSNNHPVVRTQEAKCLKIPGHFTSTVCNHLSNVTQKPGPVRPGRLPWQLQHSNPGIPCTQTSKIVYQVGPNLAGSGPWIVSNSKNVVFSETQLFEPSSSNGLKSQVLNLNLNQTA